MNIERVASTDLMCSLCGEIQTIYRKKKLQKEFGHIKDLWCPYCKKDTKFIEIKDRDKTYYNLLYKKNLTDLEQFVLDNLEERRNKNDRQL